MKKLLIASVLLTALLLVVLYVFIPGRLTIYEATRTRVPSSAAERFLADTSNWKYWWPNEMKQDTGSFRFRGLSFEMGQTSPTVFAINIHTTQSTIPVAISILPISRDSSLLMVNGNMKASASPLQRLRDYYHYKDTRNSIRQWLNEFRTFAQTPANIYGMNVTQQTVQDTLLISTRKDFDHYPGTGEVYALLDRLYSHISTHNGRPTNPPMLNVVRYDSIFETMVAIPVSHTLPETGDIRIKRMVPGKILVAEVKGGYSKTLEAFRQMELYVYDYKKLSPAIPFFSLVTDRRKEIDSTKWITRVFYPVL